MAIHYHLVYLKRHCWNFFVAKVVAYDHGEQGLAQVCLSEIISVRVSSCVPIFNSFLTKLS